MKQSKLGVLISGRGSNMAAILDHIQNRRLNAEMVMVISNQPDAPGLQLAEKAGVKTVVVEAALFSSNDEYEMKVVHFLKEANVDLVVLAGYMKIVGSVLLHAFKNRILNIHPSLLPAFPGLYAQSQALEYGVTFSGCTVHFVDDTLDGGPIIMQKVVSVLPDDSVEDLSNRILEQEHVAYSEAIQLFCEQRLHVTSGSRRVTIINKK